MNNIFSFERFVKVLKYDLKMRVPAIATTFLVFLLLPHILHLIMNFGSGFREALRMELIGTMLFCISFFAPFSIYAAFREKQGIGSYLMIPSSGFEKFASMFTVCCVILPVAFFACSLVVDSLFTLVLKDIYGGFISLQQFEAEFDLGNAIITMFSVVGAALLGNVLFKKRASAKTILCLLALALLWGSVITEILFSEIFSFRDLDPTVLQAKTDRVAVITEFVLVGVSVLLYCLAYWRLKKIQIS